MQHRAQLPVTAPAPRPLPEPEDFFHHPYPHKESLGRTNFSCPKERLLQLELCLRT